MLFGSCIPLDFATFLLCDSGYALLLLFGYVLLAVLLLPAVGDDLSVLCRC